MNMDIGSTIKKLRMDSKITQEEVARYLGISFQAVSNRYKLLSGGYGGFLFGH